MVGITPEHRLILGNRFPNWPILTQEQLELRESSLKEKDSECVLCVGRRIHRRGFIYQFEWYQYVPWKGVQPSNLIPPDQDGYWDKGDGFRGCHLESIPYSYIEVPDPEAWMHNVGQDYSVAYTRGWPSDLEYAKAAAFHDFVVSLDTGFYHDMMFPVQLIWALAPK